MPVRIVSESSRHSPREPQPDFEPKDKRGGKWIRWGAVITTSLLLLAVAGTWWGSKHIHITSPSPEASPSAQWPDAAAPATPAPSTTAAPSGAPIPGVDGLWRGTAATTGNSGGSYLGIPVGWPQNLDGAVSAAMIYQGAVYQPVTLLPGTKSAIQHRLYTSQGLSTSALTDAITKQMRSHYRVNAAGQIALNGAPSPKERLYADAYPRYGAYKVVSHEGPDSQPTAVVVDVWMPRVVGPGTATKLDEVFVGWVRALVEVKWDGKDWRINAVHASQSFHKPADSRRTNQPFAVRRDLLGPGWFVLADATEAVIPGAVLAR